jgi:signal transduction histidine kinase
MSAPVPVTPPPHLHGLLLRLFEAGLVVICVGPALGWGLGSHAATPEAATVAIGGILAGAAVLLRRRGSVVALAALAAIVIAAGGPALGYPALLVAVATVAAERPWREGALAGVVAVVALLAHRVAWGDPVPAGMVLSAAATAAAAVTAGLYLQVRQVHADELAERGVAEERLRIARELHDVVAHDVSLMVVQAQALGVTAAPGDTVATTAERIAGLGRDAMAEMHRTLVLLRAGDERAERAPQPALARLDDLVARARAAGVDVALRQEGRPRALPAGVELSAYRIVQEALTNVVRHAAGGCATVTLRYGLAALELVVEDDGPMALAAPAAQGHGLIGMRERAALFGGTLHAAARDAGGFRVEAVLPYDGSGGL